MALTIGQVAKAANVHVETLRYYERRGLSPAPGKRRCNSRCRSEKDGPRLRTPSNLSDSRMPFT
jgi:MerR family mercuric resistance operon transcriptional regulator